MKWIRYLFILSFLGLLYFPVINNMTGFIVKSYDGIIPQAPRFDIKRLDGFPKNFENYFDDRLEIKPWLVSVNSNMKIRLLGVSPVPEKVIIGSDGWLYMGGKTNDEYRGSILFTNAELLDIRKKLDGRAAYYRDKYGAVTYFFIAPLKHTIYPEYLPKSVQKINTTTRFDQVMGILEGDTIVHTLDLRQELIKNKSGHLLFYKTDNHWNDIGGYIAYQKMASLIRIQFPQIPQLEPGIFRLDSNVNLIGGEAEMMNAGNLFSEKRFDYYPTEKCKAQLMPKHGYPTPYGFPFPNDYEIQMQTGDSSLPNALIIRDSFGDALLPLLSENFNRSVFIFDAWEYGINRKIFEAEKPDLVIYIILESNLDFLLNYE